MDVSYRPPTKRKLVGSLKPGEIILNGSHFAGFTKCVVLNVYPKLTRGQRWRRVTVQYATGIVGTFNTNVSTAFDVVIETIETSLPETGQK